jgi:hypothetical protein
MTRKTFRVCTKEEEERELYSPTKTQLYIHAIAKTEIITAGY